MRWVRQHPKATCAAPPGRRGHPRGTQNPPIPGQVAGSQLSSQGLAAESNEKTTGGSFFVDWWCLGFGFQTRARLGAQNQGSFCGSLSASKPLLATQGKTFPMESKSDGDSVFRLP